MKRLFALGCSHTRYVWPTYADIISAEFDYYENWGMPGIGNFAIFHRLIEILNTRNLTDNDTVIIQWTYPHRFDFHKSPNGWYQGGNLIFQNDIIQKTILQYCWAEDSYTTYTNNYVQAVNKILIDCPSRIIFTSSLNHELIDDKWISSISVLENSEFKKRRFLNANPNKRGLISIDEHYTPPMHLEFLTNHTDFTITEKMLQYVSKAEDILNDVRDWKEIMPAMSDAGLLDKFVHGKI